MLCGSFLSVVNSFRVFCAFSRNSCYSFSAYICVHLRLIVLFTLCFRDWDSALKTFRVAYTFEKEEENRAGIAFRIVDILLAKEEDLTALKELEHIKREFPNTQYARHATERVQRLKLAKLRKLKR